ncbi:hypothetical protein V8F33_012663 [Rhypophila sp. PSN 637]
MPSIYMKASFGIIIIILSINQVTAKFFLAFSASSFGKALQLGLHMEVLAGFTAPRKAKTPKHDGAFTFTWTQDLDICEAKAGNNMLCLLYPSFWHSPTPAIH